MGLRCKGAGVSGLFLISMRLKKINYAESLISCTLNIQSFTRKGVNE